MVWGGIGVPIRLFIPTYERTDSGQFSDLDTTAVVCEKLTSFEFILV